MERLTIKELAPYLPYGLKVAYYFEDRIICISPMTPSMIGNSFTKEIPINTVLLNDGSCKPILRPLSQLTEEIEHNGGRIIFSDVYLSKTQLEKLQNPSLCAWGSILNEFDYNFIQSLLSYHFDVFGLIDRGLALPIDGKEVEV